MMELAQASCVALVSGVITTVIAQIRRVALEARVTIILVQQMRIVPVFKSVSTDNAEIRNARLMQIVGH